MRLGSNEDIIQFDIRHRTSMATYEDEIIDTHMHLWDLANNYSWLNEAEPNLELMLGDYQSLRKNFLIEDYLALALKNNITKSIHIEAFGFPEDSIKESQWLQKLADNVNFPNGIVAYAKLDEANIEEVLAGHVQYANVRGIRMVLNWHDTPHLRMSGRPDYMTDEKWLYGFSLLSKYHLSFDLQVFDHQLSEVMQLAQRFPDTEIIVEHLAWPTAFTSNDFKAWQKRLTQIAVCDNVSIKLSCIGCAFQKKISAKQIQAYIQYAINTFGVERCLFGSNFPPDRLFYTLNEIVDIMREALFYLPYNDQRAIFYDNANRIYRLR